MLSNKEFLIQRFSQFEVAEVVTEQGETVFTLQSHRHDVMSLLTKFLANHHGIRTYVDTSLGVFTKDGKSGILFTQVMMNDLREALTKAKVGYSVESIESKIKVKMHEYKMCMYQHFINNIEKIRELCTKKSSKIYSEEAMYHEGRKTFAELNFFDECIAKIAVVALKKLVLVVQENSIITDIPYFGTKAEFRLPNGLEGVADVVLIKATNANFYELEIAPENFLLIDSEVYSAYNRLITEGCEH